MKLRLTKPAFLVGLTALALALGSCQNSPKTNIEKIDDLRRQVQADAQTLHELETRDYAALAKDFRTCDSLLQYMSQEQIDKSFETLQLVQAYLEQFKVTQPDMQAEMDSTLLQLDRLKADAESHYLSDSLVAVYIDSEAEYVDKLNNQVRYFQDRFGKCQKDIAALKKQR